MNVVFCEPPAGGEQIPERFAGCSYELFHFPDLANLTLAALLQDAGHDVSYLDATLNGWATDEFLARVENARPDAVVIHSVILAKPVDLQAARTILDRTDARILFHGPEPTRVPEEYLTDDRITVLRGEPEPHIVDVLAGIFPKGVSHRAGGKIVHEAPDPDVVEFDDLPVPLRSVPGIGEHRDSFHNPKFRASPFTTVMASRGCAFRCLFCVPNSISFARELEYMKHFGKKPPVRAASPERMIAEFRQLKADGYRSVMIVDDQFLWKKQRTIEFCEGVRDLGVTWGCLSRADFLTDREIVKAMAEAGCVSIDIGVESLDAAVLREIRKDLDPETVDAAVRNLKEFSIEPKINIVFGTCARETPEMAMGTVSKLVDMDVDNVMFSLATPFKGTEFYDVSRRAGFLVDESESIDPLRKSMISYPGFTKEQLERANRKAYRRFYLRPRFVWRRLKTIRGPRDLLRDIGVALRIFR